MAFLNNVRMLLLAAWLGAAIFFSAAVAPSAFAVLRSFSLTNAGEIAGSIVTRTLSVVNISGFVVEFAVARHGVCAQEEYCGVGRSFFRSILLVIMAIATAVGEWVIAAKMRGLRAAMHGQIDQLPLTDANRMAFAALHGYSVAALGVAIIAALIAFFVMAKRVKSN